MGGHVWKQLSLPAVIVGGQVDQYIVFSGDKVSFNSKDDCSPQYATRDQDSVQKTINKVVGLNKPDDKHELGLSDKANDKPNNGASGKNA